LINLSTNTKKEGMWTRKNGLSFMKHVILCEEDELSVTYRVND
jgi:hypothetical protein